MLNELFKNKGVQSSIFNYRDVFIGSLPGKAFSRHIRSVILPFVLSLLGTHSIHHWILSFAGRQWHRTTMLWASTEASRL